MRTNNNSGSDKDFERWKGNLALRKAFGKKLQDVRHSLGCTNAQQLAGKIPISESTLENLEAGNYLPFGRIIGLKRFLSISVEERKKEYGKYADSNLGAGFRDSLELNELIDYVCKLSENPPSYFLASQKRQIEHKIQNSDVLSIFHHLLAQSFKYCLNKVNERSPESNTCMFFYGLAFNPESPVIQRESIIQAIRTEWRHLRDSIDPTKRHNTGLDPGVAQVADEIIDMLRMLFLLAIAYDIHEFHDLPWASAFNSGYQERTEDSSGQKTLPLRELNELVIKLQAMAFDPSKDIRRAIKRWLPNALRSLGTFAKKENVSYSALNRDLSRRVPQKKSNPRPSVAHPRHANRFKSFWTFVICGLTFEDIPGAYRRILDRFADANVNLVATDSFTVLWGENAKAKFLFEYGSNDSNELDKVTSDVDSILSWGKSWRDNANEDHSLITSIVKISSNTIKINSAAHYLEELNRALRQFKAADGFDFISLAQTVRKDGEI